FIEVISLSKLMKQPKDLAGMGNKISGEFQPDNAIDLIELQAAIKQDLFGDALSGLPAEWNAQKLRCYPFCCIEPPDKLICQFLRAAPYEWSCIVDYQNIHDVSARTTVSQSTPSCCSRDLFVSPMAAVRLRSTNRRSIASASARGSGGTTR